MFTTFTRAPQIIGVRLSPAPRMAPPIANCRVRGTMPTKPTVRNVTPASATSPVPPASAMSGSVMSHPTQVSRRLKIVPRTIPWRRAFPATAGVRAPVACATTTVVPIPNALRALNAMNMICKLTPDPASADGPRRPVIATSAMPTAVDSRCSTTTGHANLITSRRSFRSDAPLSVGIGGFATSPSRFRCDAEVSAVVTAPDVCGASSTCVGMA